MFKFTIVIWAKNGKSRAVVFAKDRTEAIEKAGKILGIEEEFESHVEEVEEQFITPKNVKS